jgi:hypothetical protein
MSDSIEKYEDDLYWKSNSSNGQTLRRYPGDIKVTMDEPKKDSYVQIVKAKFEERSQRGMKKYGTNLEREDLDIFEWLNHLQEELMDATLYVERLKAEIGDKLCDR